MSTVVTCPPERRGELVDTLAAAFATDPVVTWLLGAAERRRRRFFRMLVSPATVGLGGCDRTDGGAAVWHPPGTFARTAENTPALAPLHER